MKNYKKKNPQYTNDHFSKLESSKSVMQASEPTQSYHKNRCLYCYENLDQGHFHLACTKKFFGQAYEPSLDYNREDMQELAKKIIGSNQGVTGVQPKISLSWYRKNEDNRVKKLTIVGLYGDYILKPASDHYRSLPELEDCTMHMAEVCGLRTVPHTLFYLNDGSLSYLTKRVDRIKKEKRHMEDMCQLSERMTDDKYKGSHEQVAKLLMKYSASPMLDVTNFYEYVMFSFLTGNADMHLKNFSLLETSQRDAYTLAPAYDLLNTKLVNPNNQEELALTLNAKKSKLSYKDFLAAYTTSNLTQKVLDSTVENFYYCRFEMKEILYRSFLPEDMKSDYEKLFDERMVRMVKKVEL
jgi:serine/threonine-protein kinase HipA